MDVRSMNRLTSISTAINAQKNHCELALSSLRPYQPRRIIWHNQLLHYSIVAPLQRCICPIALCPFLVDMVGYETYNYLPFLKLMTLTTVRRSFITFFLFRKKKITIFFIYNLLVGTFSFFFFSFFFLVETWE